ncbi:MAG: translation initiation factor IF-2, partial [Planctomycetaceae bacterium]|nr:translation initiation factor IF-2 [Planctomycetaceae bacterium]
GVMPQTVEAINHARAAEVPIVVALNKFDLPGINEQKVLQELSTNNILPVEWGGDVEVIRTSGTTGLGIDNLLETLLLTAEILELKANPNRPAMGVCLEAFRDEGRGTVAWFMNQNGTLKTGDVVICGETYGRIRAMYNDRDEELTEALPSTPLKVSGLDQVPSPGDKFYVMPDIEEARQLAETRQSDSRAEALSLKVKPRTLEDILNPERAGTVQDLPLILKADTPGSIEALRHELGKLDHPEVRVQILHDGVGGVNESDVSLAQATGAIIVAFHVVPEERARAAAEQFGIDIRSYNIIYEVTDEIKLALEGLLKPELKQIATGRALVLRTFNISRFGTIAGCRVLNGTIERNNRVRLIRENRILNEYNIGSLKREKDDAKEVREGMECGIRLENFNDIKEGDLLEAYRVEEIKRTL